MMKRLSLILLASAGLLAIGEGACSINVPPPADLYAPFDAAMPVTPDLSSAPDGGVDAG